jgi:G-patch protein
MTTPQPIKKVSLALGPIKSKAIPKSTSLRTSNGVKRRSAHLGDSDEEEESSGKHQSISHFDQDAGGAIHDVVIPKPSQKLIITAKPNHDRLDYKRRAQKSVLPAQEDAQIAAPTTSKPVAYGLIIPQNRPAANDEPDQVETNGPSFALNLKTEDEIALDALKGKETSNRTIPVTTEDEAYKRDLNDAQNAPTLAEYLSIPVSEFGAACLRGMGWKETDSISGNKNSQTTLKPRILDRRPALLGVGAKPSSAIGVEIGEWGKAAKSSKGEGYNPVVLKNKVTGEVLSESELNKKLDDQKRQENQILIDKDKNQSQIEKYRKERTPRSRDQRDDRKGDEYRSSRKDSDHRYRDSRNEGKSRSERRDRSRRRSSSRDRYHSTGREVRSGRTRSRSLSPSKHRPRKYRDADARDKSDERDRRTGRRDNGYKSSSKKSRSGRDDQESSERRYA